jgi:membrane protein DedA with SNARE-associated domain
MSARRFLPANAVWALAWALGLGLGSYAIGPGVREIYSDIGLIGTVLLVALALGAVLVTRSGIRRRRG